MEPRRIHHDIRGAFTLAIWEEAGPKGPFWTVRIDRHEQGPTTPEDRVTLNELRQEADGFIEVLEMLREPRRTVVAAELRPAGG